MSRWGSDGSINNTPSRCRQRFQYSLKNFFPPYGRRVRSGSRRILQFSGIDPLDRPNIPRLYASPATSSVLSQNHDYIAVDEKQGGKFKLIWIVFYLRLSSLLQIFILLLLMVLEKLNFRSCLLYLVVWFCRLWKLPPSIAVIIQIIGGKRHFTRHTKKRCSFSWGKNGLSKSLLLQKTMLLS